MKSTLGAGLTGCLAGVFCLVLGGVPAAAAQGPAQANGKVMISKVDIQRDLMTPDYNTLHTYSQARSVDKWMNFVVEYSTANGTGKDYAGKTGWQDEVMVEWTVLLRRKNAKDILMHRTVTYRDVEDSKGKHYADVYIRPGFIKRIVGRSIEKRDVYVYVQIKIADRTEAVFRSDRESFKWWDWEPPKIEIHNEELLTRDETPFAPLDYDFYEQMIPKPTR